MADNSSTQELLKTAFWSEANKIYTAIPCIVVNVLNDFKEQMVDVQPSIDILLKDGSTKARPVILGVPVMQYASSTSAITIPINKGDDVVCVFSMRALEVWQESDGKPSVPNNYAKFHEKDAIAIPGVFPRKKAINNPNKRRLTHSTKDLAVTHNIGTAQETEIRFKPNGDIIMTSPSKVVVNTPVAEVNAISSLTVNSPTSNFNGNVNVSGTVTASVDVIGGGKSLKTHIHEGSPTAPNGPVTPTGAPV